MEQQSGKKEFKAPEDLIQFIADTRDGKFSCTSIQFNTPADRLPNYHYPIEPVYLHGIR